MEEKKYISDYLMKNASDLADKPFLICPDRTLSWAEVYKESGVVAAFIAAKLAGRQQKIISFLMSDSWEFVVAYFGIVLSGNIALPIDITFKKLEIDSVIGAAAPEMVIATKDTRDSISARSFLLEDILLGHSAAASPAYKLPPEEQIATLFLSSGTTGKPKAIPNTHANQLWDVAAIAGPMGWTSRDVLLVALHLAHRHGLVICLLSAVYHGNTVYLEERFSAQRVMELLGSGKVTLYSGVPAAYEALIKYEPGTRFDLSGVRLFASSSSALPPHLFSAFLGRFGHDILDRYGTSETGSIAIKTSATGGVFNEVLEGVQLRLEKNGEVALKSPGLFPGYYKNPEATRESMTKDGWWLPGDIGELKDGKLILKGRSKERISKSGYSVYPQDIEWALSQNPKVAEVKVTAVSSPKSLDDEIIALYSGQIEEERLEDYSRLNLPRSWRPDVFIKVAAIPRTANGKPSLVKVKKLLAEEYSHRVSSK